MKITDIRIHQPIGLLRIGTDEGIEGCCLGVDENTARHIQSAYRDYLIGQDPFDRQRIWEELSRRDRFQYLPQPVRGHVDVAIWDLLGKATGLPVYRLIGGFRDSIPAYKMGPNFDTVERFVAEAVQARDEGFYGYKDHFRDNPPEMMMEVARESRRAVGPDFHLMHDAVQQYVFSDALRVGRVLQEEEYFWFEEPLRDFDLMGLKKLAAALDIPIAATEYLPGTIYSTSQLVAQQAVDIVRASVPWRGGITDMLMIARLAEAFGMNCEITSRGVMHGFVHAHVIGAIRNCTFYETTATGSQGGEPLIVNPLVLENGHLPVPQGPGLGAEFDWDEVEKQTQSVLGGI
jgi:L-alanine-DL-glutamate epimerase-like enolase superfamily enzyme